MESVIVTAVYHTSAGFSVVTGGQGCKGRWWDIAWDTRGADIPSMAADGTNLQGSDPMVAVVTLVDGGMWLRPLRGDMLRLPELSPQVTGRVKELLQNNCLPFAYIGRGNHQPYSLFLPEWELFV